MKGNLLIMMKYLQGWSATQEKSDICPRKFKGESVVAAILPSHMEVSYCSSEFFRKLSPPNNFIWRELPFPHGLKSRTHVVIAL